MENAYKDMVYWMIEIAINKSNRSRSNIIEWHKRFGKNQEETPLFLTSEFETDIMYIVIISMYMESHPEIQFSPEYMENLDKIFRKAEKEVLYNVKKRLEDFKNREDHKELQNTFGAEFGAEFEKMLNEINTIVKKQSEKQS